MDSTDPRGRLTSNQRDDAYGRTRYGNLVVTDHKFTGQKLDATGLQYFNARYYDPEIGQFIGGPLGADTFVPDPGQLLDYNCYAYACAAERYPDLTGHDQAIWMALSGAPLF